MECTKNSPSGAVFRFRNTVSYFNMYYDLEGAKEQVKLIKYGGNADRAEFKKDVARLESGEPLA
jgi:hypothetical protein